MTFSDDTGTHDPPVRAAYRVPVGLPLRDEGRRQGVIVSVVVHALILALLLMPIVFAHSAITRIEQGAGGAGPAGGGGGGSSGETGARETLRYVRVARDPVPTPAVLPPIPKPVAVPVPQVQPPPVPVTKAPDVASSPAPVSVVASTGAGAGSGRDGITGNGPGSGGGVGAGVGAGRGSGTGPGTGGGTQVNYPPSPIELFLPPLPTPKSARGFQFVAEFDVDSTGKVLDVKFSETHDGDYNRRMASVLRAMRFRPGTRPDGTPLRMKAQISYEF